MFVKTLIRGPTHVTKTDVWVSRGDTLSLFKRRGEKGIGSGNWCGLTVRTVNGGDEFEPGPLDHWITIPEVNSPRFDKVGLVAHQLHRRRHTAVNTR